MQPFSKSSFIPKKTIKRVERVRGKKRVYIISYIAYALFFGTLVATLLVFLYQSYLEGELESNISALDEQRKTYNHADLQLIQEWEYKLRLAESFYYSHLSPYQVLRDLEQFTSSDIRFTTFSYTTEEKSVGGPQVISVTLGGEADRFDSVAFQDDSFSEESMFRAAEFTSVAKTVAEDPASTLAEAEAAAVVASEEGEELPPKPVAFTVAAELRKEDVQFDVSVYDQSITTGSIDSATDIFIEPTVEAVPEPAESESDESSTESTETTLPTSDEVAI